MKIFYRFYTILLTMMILLITTSAGALFTGDRQAGIKANDHLVKASTTLSDREAVPEGLTKTEWGKISASIERDRYRMHKDDRTGEYQAPNYAHGLDATFTREGFQVTPRKGEKGWNWGLSLSRYGYGPDLHSVPVAEKIITKDNRIEYHRGDMLEWYINDHRGLEQGFTLKARPSGRTGSALLQLQMRTTTKLIPVVEKEGKGIVFRDAHGKEVLRYRGLYAYDAAGRELGARMAADQEWIRLIVEDHEAIYPITIDPFIERKKLLAGDGQAGDLFGNSVSISGDTVIVGAIFDDDNGTQSGSAYIFYRDQGGADMWGQVKKLTAGDGASFDYFGCSVSISGDTAIVGADGDNSASGSAYIFYRDQGGADNWGQVKKLTAGDGEEEDYFGGSVSISGDKVIVGAFGDDDNGHDSGSAYIFFRDQGGADNWGQVKNLVAGDWAADDWFGYSVSISGNTAIVGVPYDDENGDYSGSAYIFSRDQGEADNWGEVKKLTASDGAGGDNFGRSVSISEDTAIVGAHWDDDNGDDSGSAYIFSVPAFGDELACDFGVDGLWHYDGSTWTQLNGQNPEGMEEWNEGLATDFSSLGLWNYDGFSWDALTTLNPQDMRAWDDSLAVDFGGTGLWNYNGSSWDLLTTNDPQDMEAWTNGLAVDFGTFGLWNYNGSSWNLLTTSDAEGMTAWSGDLAVDFGTFGLWSYNGSSWDLLTTSDAQSMEAWSGGLAVDFDTFGLWNYNGSSWSLLTTSNAEFMAAWASGLAVDFGGTGLWSYNGSSWDLLTTSDPQDMEGWATSLAVDLGASGLWNYDGSSWANLTGLDSEDMIDVNLY